jgi:hypothetical protein
VKEKRHFGGEKSCMMMVGSLVEKMDYAYLGISQSSSNALIGSGRDGVWAKEIADLRPKIINIA